MTDACKAHGGFYLGSIGGPAARLAQDCIKQVEVLEYPELGMEAVWKIEVEDFPAFIVVDDKGNDFFVLVMPHTRCAMASNTEDELRERVGARRGRTRPGRASTSSPTRTAALRADGLRSPTRSSPSRVAVGGFVYDVDSGLLAPVTV